MAWLPFRVSSCLLAIVVPFAGPTMYVGNALTLVVVLPLPQEYGTFPPRIPYLRAT